MLHAHRANQNYSFNHIHLAFSQSIRHKKGLRKQFTETQLRANIGNPPSTAVTGAVFGQLKVLSGKSRVK
jgi:hypothetical protein